MSVVRKQSERIKFKIDDIEVTLKPLSYHEKNTISAMMFKGHKNQDMALMANGTIHAVRCCLKAIKGLQFEDEDGQLKDYVLEFDESGILTDDCMSDLMNMEPSAKLIQVCSLFIDKIPKEITIDGVSFVKSEDTSKKKTE